MKPASRFILQGLAAASLGDHEIALPPGTAAAAVFLSSTSVTADCRDATSRLAAGGLRLTGERAADHSILPLSRARAGWTTRFKTRRGRLGGDMKRA